MTDLDHLTDAELDELARTTVHMDTMRAARALLDRRAQRRAAERRAQARMQEQAR